MLGLKEQEGDTEEQDVPLREQEMFEMGAWAVVVLVTPVST